MKRYLILPVIVVLSACGSGSSSSTTGITPVTPAPTVSITLSTSKASVSETVKISWTSTNATSCTGADGFSGTQPSTGSIDFKPTTGGQFKYTLSCTGAGGTGSNTQTLIVPIPVQRTSYLNAKNINIGPQLLPQGIGFVKNEGITAGFQFGDFFQDGTIAMVASSNVFNGSNGFGSVDAGRMYFFHTDGKGGWIDQTDKLLSSTARTGCISPRKVIVADFNGDRKPDVFVACHGIDGKVPSGYNLGEKPRYLLSQLDGTYRNIELPISCYCHGAAAADLTGDGFADIVIASPLVLEKATYLKNNKDGTFTRRDDLVPSSTNRRAIWSLEFLDANNDGNTDLAMFGSENTNGYTIPNSSNINTPGTANWDFPVTFFLNDGSNTFTSNTNKVEFPYTAFGDAIDMIVNNGKVVLYRSQWWNKQHSVQVWSFDNRQKLSELLVPEKDTVWITLYNNDVVSSFVINPFTLRL
jgi:hypothetical protein